MPKHRRARSIPNGGAAALPGTRGVLELERFTDTDLTRWNRLSEHLDYLHNLLHFGFESQRSTFRSALIAALQSAGPCRLEISRWCRIVQHRYSLDPLSPEGSLFHVGGRFNVGRDVPIDVRAPWPALYLASDTETAYREKYGMARNESIGGLSREELALMPQESHALVMVNGVVENTFDLSNVAALAPLCKVLAKFKMPPEVYRALKALRIDRRKVQVRDTHQIPNPEHPSNRTPANSGANSGGRTPGHPSNPELRDTRTPGHPSNPESRTPIKPPFSYNQTRHLPIELRRTPGHPSNPESRKIELRDTHQIANSGTNSGTPIKLLRTPGHPSNRHFPTTKHAICP